jgi:hypothetical protein
MTCNGCEVAFRESQCLLMEIEYVPLGKYFVLYLTNQGRSILLIRRIVLCHQYPDGSVGRLFLRPPPESIRWSYPSDTLEQGIRASYYVWDGYPADTIFQAQAEYVELDGRALSCPATDSK